MRVKNVLYQVEGMTLPSLRAVIEERHAGFQIEFKPEPRPKIL